MTTLTYTNQLNGGRERVVINGDDITIASDWGNGFCAPVIVSISDLRRLLALTGAPSVVLTACGV